MGDHLTKPFQGALFRKSRVEIMNIPDDLDMGDMGMYGTGLKRSITCKLHNDTNPGCPHECVGDCDKVGRKIVLRSAPMENPITVRIMTLYWRKEMGHGRLGVTLTSLGNMKRRHWEKIDSKFPILSISSRYIFTE